MPPPTSVVRALKPSLFQTWSAPALVIVLLLLSTRDCAKSLVSRAGTVSRVHVSSRSGGWVCRPAAKTGRERGEEVGEEEEREEGTGREEGEEESLSAESRQAGSELAGSGCTWGAGFHLAGKNTVSNKGGLALCWGVIGHFQLDLTSLNKGVFIACLWRSL